MACDNTPERTRRFINKLGTDDAGSICVWIVTHRPDGGERVPVLESCNQTEAVDLQRRLNERGEKPKILCFHVYLDELAAASYMIDQRRIL